MRTRFGFSLLLAGMFFSGQASAENWLKVLGEKLVGGYAQFEREKPQSDVFREDDSIPIGFVFDVAQYNKLHANRARNMARFALRQVEFNACSIYASNAVNMLTLASPYTPLERPDMYGKTIYSPLNVWEGRLATAFTAVSSSMQFGPASSISKQRVVETYHGITELDPHETISVEKEDLDNDDRLAEHIDRIAARLDDGRAVIVGLDGALLLRQYGYEPPSEDARPGGHVVLFTGVQRDVAGAPMGFFIMDSAIGMTYYLDRGTLAKSWASLARKFLPSYLVSYSRYSQPFSEQISRIRYIDISYPWSNEKNGMQICFRQDRGGIDSWVVQSARRQFAREKQTPYLRLQLNKDGVYVESWGGAIASRAAPDCRNLATRQYSTAPRFDDKNKLAITGIIDFQYDYRKCEFVNEVYNVAPWVFVTPVKNRLGLIDKAENAPRCGLDPSTVSSGYDAPGVRLARPQYCDVKSYQGVMTSNRSVSTEEDSREGQPTIPLRGVACMWDKKGSLLLGSHPYLEKLKADPAFSGYKNHLGNFRQQKFDRSLPVDQLRAVAFAGFLQILASSYNGDQAYSRDDIIQFYQTWFRYGLKETLDEKRYDIDFLAGYHFLHVYFNDAYHRKNSKMSHERLYGAEAEYGVTLLEVAAHYNSEHARKLLTDIGIPRF